MDAAEDCPIAELSTLAQGDPYYALSENLTASASRVVQDLKLLRMKRDQLMGQVCRLTTANNSLRTMNEQLELQRDCQIKEISTMREQLEQANQEIKVLRDHASKTCKTNERLFRLTNASKLSANALRQSYSKCFLENDRLRRTVVRLKNILRSELGLLTSEFPDLEENKLRVNSMITSSPPAAEAAAASAGASSKIIANTSSSTTISISSDV